MCRDKEEEMAEQYYRAQLLIKPEQHQQLGQLAKQGGRSISDVTRQVLALGLEALSQQKGRQKAALKRLVQRRVRLTGSEWSPAELIAEVRKERELQIEAALSLGSPMEKSDEGGT
jgi:hypothetical protein